MWNRLIFNCWAVNRSIPSANVGDVVNVFMAIMIGSFSLALLGMYISPYTLRDL